MCKFMFWICSICVGNLPRLRQAMIVEADSSDPTRAEDGG